MNQREKALFAFLKHGDGGTFQDIMRATASSKRQTEVLLSYIPCIYIDRWTEKGEPVYCLAETPENCPKPQ
jgi:hypothetical protein